MLNRRKSEAAARGGPEVLLVTKAVNALSHIVNALNFSDDCPERLDAVSSCVAPIILKLDRRIIGTRVCLAIPRFCRDLRVCPDIARVGTTGITDDDRRGHVALHDYVYGDVCPAVTHVRVEVRSLLRHPADPWLRRPQKPATTAAILNTSSTSMLRAVDVPEDRIDIHQLDPVPRGLLNVT